LLLPSDIIFHQANNIKGVNTKISRPHHISYGKIARRYGKMSNPTGLVLNPRLLR